MSFFLPRGALLLFFVDIHLLAQPYISVLLVWLELGAAGVGRDRLYLRLLIKRILGVLRLVLNMLNLAVPAFSSLGVLSARREREACEIEGL